MKKKKILSILLSVIVLLTITSCETIDPTESGNLVPKTVSEGNVEHASHQVEINGSKLHIETYGNPNNPVIVFLHGGPGFDFRRLLRLKERYNSYSLADEYYLVFWNQRGSGLSKRHDKNVLTQNVFVEDLRQVIDRYSSDGKAFLIGHSWGGMSASLFMNRYPQKVNGAVLIESGPLTGKLFEEIKGDLIDMNLSSEWLNDYAWNSQFFSSDEHERMDYQMTLVYKESLPKYHQELEVDPAPFWRLGVATSKYIQEDGMDSNGKFNFDYTSNLQSYKTKVLFITGDLNEVIGKEFQGRQISFFNNAELSVIKNVGHDLDWLKPTEIIELTHNYLNEIKTLKVTK
ncbi:MAG: alpha/beta hydrolase [Melioribacteraceae bacterium]